MNNIKLLYIDLFCGAGGTSTGVESARHNGRHKPKVSTDEWYTPRWIIDELGPFDLDPCAPAASKVSM